MNRHVKTIAMYLPQYHTIPENDIFWGRGYTDWVAVKNAKPLFPQHKQPKIPFNRNYYDLSEPDSVRWQANLANQYGIDGFGIYHYWFDSNTNLLKRPAEILLENKDIKIDFLFAWDNATWKRTWSNVHIGNDWAPLFENGNNASNNENCIKDDGILVKLDYGDKQDWKNHFDYLLPFFKDDRYIKIDDRPVFCILNQDNGTKILSEMIKAWDQWAKENGFAGIYFIGKRKNNHIEVCDYAFLYQPEWSGWTWRNQFERVQQKIKRDFVDKIKGFHFFDYDKIWERIICEARKCTEKNLYYGGFVAYDDSPRRGKNGKIVLNSEPQKFKKYFSELCEISEKQDKEFVFLMAWNEWGEGAFLEPEEDRQYDFLNAVSKAKN